MNLSDCYLEEDLFPKIFSDYEERNYGILFYNEDIQVLFPAQTGSCCKSTASGFFIFV